MKNLLAVPEMAKIILVLPQKYEAGKTRKFNVYDGESHITVLGYHAMFSFLEQHCYMAFVYDTLALHLLWSHPDSTMSKIIKSGRFRSSWIGSTELLDFGGLKAGPLLERPEKEKCMVLWRCLEYNLFCEIDYLNLKEI